MINKNIIKQISRAEIIFVDGLHKNYIELNIIGMNGRRVCYSGFEYTDEDVQRIRDIIESNFITKVFYYGKGMNDELLAQRIAWFTEKV